jgi:trk/ktr system potassium uptake protein
MKKSPVFYIIGKLLRLLSVIMLVPLAIAYFSQGLAAPEVQFFTIALISAYITGTVLVATLKENEGYGPREGYAIVVIGWILIALYGAIPFFLHNFFIEGQPIFTAFTNSYFEIMSGFTTTGSTVITNIEILPKSLLFWRSLTHWLGGMGIVMLAIAILPAMGVGGYQMFKGEMPGSTKDKIAPKIVGTAKLLWSVYLLFTVIETVLLMFGGMSLFEALCHSFGTMATGGFSTMNASIGAYNSAYIEWVVILFMFLAGTNFVIHYQVLRGKFKVLKENKELHFYIGVLATAILVTTVVLSANGVEDPLRNSAFQVTSLTTTTGYTTANFNVWPQFTRLLLVFLMFFGGCSGSTGGGIKMSRIMILFQTGWRELKKMSQPNLVIHVKQGIDSLKEKQLINIASFFIIYIIIFVFAAMLMTLFVPDLETAITSVVATLCNIGPGLAKVGAIETYAFIPNMGKWVLIACMLIGRLELFGVLIVFRLASWRK